MEQQLTQQKKNDIVQVLALSHQLREVKSSNQVTRYRAGKMISYPLYYVLHQLFYFNFSHFCQFLVRSEKGNPTNWLNANDVTNDNRSERDKLTKNTLFVGSLNSHRSVSLYDITFMDMPR